MADIPSGAVSVTTAGRNIREPAATNAEYVSLWSWSNEEMQKPEKVEIAERSFATVGARIRDVEGECLRLVFPDKPPLYVRNELKAGGFYWNKFHRAWEPKAATRMKKRRNEIIAFAEKFVPKEEAA